MTVLEGVYLTLGGREAVWPLLLSREWQVLQSGNRMMAWAPGVIRDFK